MRIVIIFPLIALLAGCAVFKPYKMPIQQGRNLTPATIQKVLPGMTRQQVIYLLGTPNVTSQYQPNTLYYIYTNEHNYLPRAENKLEIHFKNGKVSEISGNYPPPEKLKYKTVSST